MCIFNLLMINVRLNSGYFKKSEFSSDKKKGHKSKVV